MKVYEMKLKVFMLQSIELNNLRECVCNLIDKSLFKDEFTAELHNENKFKFYTFNNLYPIESDKLYKAGNIYTLIIRTIDETLVKHFQKHLANEYNEQLKALLIESRVIPKRHIERIYNITPAVAKFENGYWKNGEGIGALEKRIKENLIKKYNTLMNDKIDEDFELFSFFKLENANPIPCKYKNIKLLGDKMTLNIAENEKAQDLAYLALGTGLLEMGTRGLGFVNYKFL